MGQMEQLLITAKRRNEHGPTRQTQHVRSMDALNETDHVSWQALDLVEFSALLASFLGGLPTVLVITILLLVTIVTATKVNGNTLRGHL